MHFVLAAHRATPTTAGLAAAGARAGVASMLLPPDAAAEFAGRGDVVLGRLDVRPTLDGIEQGVGALGRAAARGARVLNGPSALLAAHDKLLTARCLRAAGVPHPVTAFCSQTIRMPSVRPPVVVKPRFGSWGRDVVLCEDEVALESHLATLSGERWFRSRGALIQELVPPLGFDLRLVVAAGEVVGAVRREAAPGEWRTNVALGATRIPVVPPPDACSLAVSAAAAIGADLVGVDLLPTSSWDFVVLELNGAVDFTSDYHCSDGDIFDAVVQRLLAPVTAEAEPLAPLVLQSVAALRA